MRTELASALFLCACGHAAAPPSCPEGAHGDDTRAHAIEARLESVPEGHALLAASGAALHVCFVPDASPSVVTTDRVILIADGLDEGEAAARLGHLLVHLHEGLPIDAVARGLSGSACDTAVDRALALEAHAYVVELDLQTTLDARPRVLAFDFADAVREAPVERREAIVLDYLRAHPDGGPGIDGLARAYRARCSSQ